MIKIIEFQNVTKKYSKDVTAVDGISMKIKKGEFICLVGTSGNGKQKIYMFEWKMLIRHVKWTKLLHE